MSSDTLIEPSPNETLVYSPPRDPDTDDTIARLYFGPHNSPEKMLIKTMLANDDTPRRRSARLTSHTVNNGPSLAPAPVLGQVSEELDRLEIPDSGRETPNNIDDLQDEPSSALAERIIRAHDNPSPPPRSQDLPIDEPQSVSPILHPSQGVSALSGAPNVHLPPPAPLEATSAVVSDLPYVEETIGNDSIPDLISFASVSVPPSAPRDLRGSEVAGPSSAPTVDDLLSRSPTPAQSVRFTTQNLGQHPTPFLDYVGSNTKHDKGKSRLLPSNDTSTDALEQRAQPLHSLQYLTPESQPSSLRRSNSASPQRSATHSDDSFSTPLGPIAPLRLLGSSRVDRTPVKSRDSLPPTGNSEVSNHEDRFEPTSNDGRTGKKRKRTDGDATIVGSSRLGSLSPDSASALQQLIPIPKADSELRGKTPQKLSSSGLPHRVSVLPQFCTPGRLRNALGDGNGTPVRRVPIEPAPGQTNSARKDQPGTRTFGGTVFRTQALDDPNRSPVRRILITDGRTSLAKVVSNAFSRERGGSTEPRPAFKVRCASAEPVFSRPPIFSSSSNTKVTTTLPFPVTQKPSVIPEEEEEGTHPSVTKPRATSAPPVVPATPAKSSLRQPMVSSRIPRIGVKPYARPLAPEKSKLPVPASRVHASNTLTRPQRGVGSSGSSSDDAKPSSIQVPALKRKRATASKPPSSAPAKIQPHVVIMRQVPGIRAHEHSKQPAPPAGDHQPDILPASEDAIQVPELNSAEVLELSHMRGLSGNAQPTGTSGRSTRSRTGGVQEQYGARRISRSRKPHPDDDVFGSVGSTSPPAPRPVSAKRKPPSDKSGYAGLSSLALKNITTNNTAKNQQIVSVLETELVRKEGKRPESPTTKLRTISERQKEEKNLQRQERAERRARKIELGEIGEGDMDLSFMSDVPLGDDGQPLKHRRGPGDEEDYETPERPARPSKRTRIDGSEQDGDKDQKDKRVQWDRGLFTAVYLDELPDTRMWPKNENAKRSCLAKGAKAARLDPLGNVQNADAPTVHIVTERVTVKRFVYEGEEPEAEPIPEIKPLKVVKPKGRKVKV